MFSQKPRTMTETTSNTSVIKSTDDDYYEDDFEPDIISENTSEQINDDGKKGDSGNKISQNKLTGVEKGQMEAENQRKEKSTEEASDSEPEADGGGYDFTEDQQRAMMELMVQKQEDTDLLDEEPPEYNVKGRLEQLNADLANEPSPQEGDRELKVGFKPEIVDLVAPPPTFSDDESQPNSARGENKESDVEPSKTTEEPSPKPNNETESNENKQKTFVVERDGNFEVVSVNELTASERALYVNEDDEKDNKDSENKLTKDKSSSSLSSSSSPSASSSTSSSNAESNSNQSSSGTHPRPPSHARPNTATNATKRNVRPAQSPRPKSANPSSSSSNQTLENFDYCSPYAMTPEQKEKSRQLAKQIDEEKREREKQKQKEEEAKHKENDDAFRAWLVSKREYDSRRRQGREQNNESQEDKKENEEAFKSWLRYKRDQMKDDKLLKKRQQQEVMEGYHVRSREEADKAFRDWLKKKNVALRKQHETERQRNHLYHLTVRRSKKSQNLSKAMKESQSYRYVDYYGYRF